MLSTNLDILEYPLHDNAVLTSRSHLAACAKLLIFLFMHAQGYFLFCQTEVVLENVDGVLSPPSYA